MPLKNCHITFSLQRSTTSSSLRLNACPQRRCSCALPMNLRADALVRSMTNSSRPNLSSVAASGTAANVNDVTRVGAPLHGQETGAFGIAGYRGVHRREVAKRPKWHMAMQPGKRALDQTSAWQTVLKQAERLKASVRAKIEHPFHVVRNLFRHRKVRYRGQAKNQRQPFALFGLANLIVANRPLQDARG